LEGPEAEEDGNRRALMNIWRDEDLTQDFDWRQEEPDETFFSVNKKIM